MLETWCPVTVWERWFRLLCGKGGLGYCVGKVVSGYCVGKVVSGYCMGKVV